MSSLAHPVCKTITYELQIRRVMLGKYNYKTKTAKQNLAKAWQWHSLYKLNYRRLHGPKKNITSYLR